MAAVLVRLLEAAKVFGQTQKYISSNRFLSLLAAPQMVMNVQEEMLIVRLVLFLLDYRNKGLKCRD